MWGIDWRGYFSQKRIIFLSKICLKMVTITFFFVYYSVLDTRALAEKKCFMEITRFA